MDVIRGFNGEQENGKKKVLLLPWLAHGHITPYLELAARIAAAGAVVYLCSTPATLSSVKNQPSSRHVHLVELHLNSSSPDLPPPLHTTNGLPLHLNPLLKAAFDSAGPAFSSILISLRPHLLLYDFLQPWAPTLAAAADIPSVLFFPCSAAAVSYFVHLLRDTLSYFPTSSLYLRPYERRLMETKSFNDSKDGERVLSSVELSRDVIFIRTIDEMEEKYIRCLETLLGKKVVPVGALPSPSPTTEQKGMTDEIRGWLDGKGEATVVFVSFGTEYFLSEEEMEEVAWGLEMSGVNFIWVVRYPTGEERRGLPEGFEERVDGRGLVVGWAAQKEILQHRSVGGMVSHCGWGSVMETITSGVGVVAMPMHLDQFLNCRVVVESGVGIEVERDESGRLHREKVAEVIKEVVEGKVEGAGVRKKMKEMMETVRRDDAIDIALDTMFHLMNPPCSNSIAFSSHRLTAQPLAAVE